MIAKHGLFLADNLSRMRIKTEHKLGLGINTVVKHTESCNSSGNIFQFDNLAFPAEYNPIIEHQTISDLQIFPLPLQST